MKTAEIVHVAGMFEGNVADSLCWYSNIPILVSRRRRMRDKIAVRPFDRGRVEERSLVPLGEARLGRIGLDEWLRRSRAGG